METWSKRFAARRSRRPDFAPAPVVAGDRRQRAVLARSLAHFQLGETGTGEHLFASAARVGHADRVPVLRAFLAEEHDHARWLARAVEALGGRLRRRHWAAGAFVWLRRAGGLHGEMLVLLLAEIVGAAYYRALAAHVEDDGVRAILAQIARDEGVHLAFQIDWHRRLVAQIGPLGRAAAVLAVWLLFRVVCVAVLLEHHRALQLAGGSGAWWRRAGDLFTRVADAALRAPLVRPARGRMPPTAAATAGV